ncbi:DUF3822 family protein [Flavobacterium cyclinae]|uniref:DUF3822 family protein n=1 Tax=Flavobacterium cyclinae TaxID=2895947 RepID=UPI001E4F73A2|nr:DUF3822 family protein [Flavobacterium cyclinae]UGS20000.1 DUF3822 family protein [Flavobacterium cyclinae]
MVITNNDITQKTYKKLSIQVSLSGLSFCVFDLLSHKIVNSMAIEFEKHKVLEEQLWKAFIEFPILTKSFDEIMVVHDNNLNTFVPTSLFDVHFLASYLQYNTKVFETDFFTHDVIFPYEMNNVYVPFVNINNFLLDQFDTFEYQNSNSILVKQLLDLSKNNDEKQVFVHLQKEHFEIVIVKNQQLLFYNSFHYQTPEDFIYYLLFTCEQLQLNPETISVQLLGNCSEQDNFFKIAYKYIRNCNLLDVSNTSAVLDVSSSDLRNHFILYHS